MTNGDLTFFMTSPANISFSFKASEAGLDKTVEFL